MPRDVNEKKVDNIGLESVHVLSFTLPSQESVHFFQKIYLAFKLSNHI